MQQDQCFIVLDPKQVRNALWVLCGSSLLNPDQLYIEDEGGVGRDNARVAPGPVGVVRGTGERCALAHAQLKQKINTFDFYYKIQKG